MSTETFTRSAQSPTMYTVLRYEHAREAVEWLQAAFGLEPGAVYPAEGPGLDHAVMFHGMGGVMVGPGSDTEPATHPTGNSRATGVYVVVDDVDGHCVRSRAAGAEITMEPYDTDYGSREYTARDLEGHLWSFGTYRPERPAIG